MAAVEVGFWAPSGHFGKLRVAPATREQQVSSKRSQKGDSGGGKTSLGKLGSPIQKPRVSRERGSPDSNGDTGQV